MSREMNVLPWEKLSGAQPPLRALLQSDEQKWPRQGRALVPGCGRVCVTIFTYSSHHEMTASLQGYDPIFIAATLGLDTLAVDISTTAVRSANACD